MEKAISPLLKPNDYLPAFADRMSLIRESKKYSQNYVVYRVNLKAIEIDQETRNTILDLMGQAKKFVQIDDYTIMLNSICAIEPMPVKPQPKTGHYEGKVWIQDEV
jgi:hypothetical protein